MGAGGILNSGIRAFLGESGPEAVVPLSQPALSRAGLGSGSSHYSPNINFTVNVTGGDSDAIVDRIKSEFSDLMSESYFKFQRRRLA